MKYVIDIPEDVKKAFDESTKDDLYGCYYDANSVIGKAIRHATPLPKGHGLYDIDFADIPDIPTIIEADQEGAEK